MILSTGLRAPLARLPLLALPVLVGTPATAQDAPIADNSFLIEEAYNQEPRVVQHIATFERFDDGGGWVSSFTQEWPVPDMRHQLSYTLSAVDPGDGFDGGGIGDFAINYRYQLLGMEAGSSVAFSPRVSLLLATGDEEEGRGAGGHGLQLNLPLSVDLGPALVTHLNAGATHLVDATDGAGREASLDGVHLGGSLIWRTTRRFNVMLEALWTRTDAFDATGATDPESAMVVSPGVRWAHDFESGLQIVPGIAFPIGVGPSDGERSVFLYVSFEHPF